MHRRATRTESLRLQEVRDRLSQILYVAQGDGSAFMRAAVGNEQRGTAILSPGPPPRDVRARITFEGECHACVHLLSAVPQFFGLTLRLSVYVAPREEALPRSRSIAKRNNAGHACRLTSSGTLSSATTAYTSST